MGNRSLWGELDDEGLAEDELLAEVRTLLGGLNPAPELSLSETESARADHVLSRLLIDTTSAPPDDPRRREGPGPSHRGRWPLAPSSKKRAAIALGVAACAAALVATVAVVALQGDRNPASAQPALPRPLTFANGGHAAAVSLLERAAALQVSQPSGPGGRSRYAKTQNYAVNVNVGGTHNTTTTFVVTTVQQVWVAPGCKALEKSYSQATSATTGADIEARGRRAPMSTGSTPTAASRPPRPQSWPGWWALTAATWTDKTVTMPSQTAPWPSSAWVRRRLAKSPRSTGSWRAFLGVFYAGTVTDDAGRLGQAVGVPSGLVNTPPTPVPKNLFVPAGCAHAKGGAGWDYFVLSPKTGQPLEVEEVDSTPPCALRLPPGPFVGQYNVVLASGAVSASGVLPK